MDAADTDFTWMQAHAGTRLTLIAESHLRVTGRPLAAPAELWHLPAVVVAHGTQGDPVFFYGNRRALDLFELDAPAFTRLPSRYSAEPMERGERAALLDRVTRNNFIDDYSGVRVSSTGKRFMIEQATVWNLIAADGTIHGQAATFSQLTRLSPRESD